MRNKKSKTKREVLLAQQGNVCALCKERYIVATGMCYVVEQNAMLCRSCSTFVHVCDDATKRGVTFYMLVQFRESEPRPKPTVKSERRQTVETGRMAFDGYIEQDRNWFDRLTGEPMTDENKRRAFADWDEYIRYHPEHAEKT